jgi:hypothetical protein
VRSCACFARCRPTSCAWTTNGLSTREGGRRRDPGEETRTRPSHWRAPPQDDLPAVARLWEGSLAALRALTEAGWPAMRDSKGLMEWAVDEWVGHATWPSTRPIGRGTTDAGGTTWRPTRGRRWLRWLKPAPDLPGIGALLIDHLDRGQLGVGATGPRGRQAGLRARDRFGCVARSASADQARLDAQPGLGPGAPDACATARLRPALPGTRARRGSARCSCRPRSGSSSACSSAT